MATLRTATEDLRRNINRDCGFEYFLPDASDAGEKKKATSTEYQEQKPPVPALARHVTQESHLSIEEEDKAQQAAKGSQKYARS